MKMTQREFRIAAGAALFGFVLCYFLFGTNEQRGIGPKLTVIAASPFPANTNPRTQIRIHGVQTNVPRLPNAPTAFGYQNRPSTLPFPIQIHDVEMSVQKLPTAATGFGYRVGPLWPPDRPSVDLFSARYRIDVDLSDLR